MELGLLFAEITFRRLPGPESSREARREEREMQLIQRGFLLLATAGVIALPSSVPVSSGGDPMVFIPLKDAQEAQFLKDNDSIVNDRTRTAATRRNRLFRIPGRLTRTARQVTLRMPARWPWQQDFTEAPTRIRALPAAA